MFAASWVGQHGAGATQPLSGPRPPLPSCQHRGGGSSSETGTRSGGKDRGWLQLPPSLGNQRGERSTGLVAFHFLNPRVAPSQGLLAMEGIKFPAPPPPPASAGALNFAWRRAWPRPRRADALSFSSSPLGEGNFFIIGIFWTRFDSSRKVCVLGEGGVSVVCASFQHACWRGCRSPRHPTGNISPPPISRVCSTGGVLWAVFSPALRTCGFSPPLAPCSWSAAHLLHREALEAKRGGSLKQAPHASPSLVCFVFKLLQLLKMQKGASGSLALRP